MRGSGGTEGGLGLFAIGFGLSAVAMYVFLDSVQVTTANGGLITGMLLSGRGQAGWWETTSMGIIFIPFILGIIALFYDAKQKWAWWLMYLGIGVIVVEILSRINFLLRMKTTHLLMMMLLFSAGVGLMLRSYRDSNAGKRKDNGAKNGDSAKPGEATKEG
ncbi:MAG: hypothetical protein NTX50_19265 [Candidatus Sumerlaeota bacterium]|nr:hypothetical protein [Candidatus Sumerlaeota bacterium]